MNLHSRRKAAFTLIELLVVLFILTLIIAITVPAVMQARESARRAECLSNLKSIALAINSHLEQKNYYPREENLYSPFVFMLPYLDQSPLFNSFNLTQPRAFVPGSTDVNDSAYATRLRVFVCPSDTMSLATLGPCTYGGNLGTGVGKWLRPDNGPFASSLIDPKIIDALVRDGLANTVAVSEFCRTQGPSTPRNRHAVFTIGAYDASQFDSMITDCSAVNIDKQPMTSPFRGFCWAFGGIHNSLYDHNIPPNSPACACQGGTLSGVWTASSNHPGGVNCAHLDGHVSFIEDTISMSTWRAMGTMSGGEIVSHHD
jgi:prepilin-type N-terminal cleavage/methylation domain-containing protein/prepilin-type processing-associated H-X9-DG protein